MVFLGSPLVLFLSARRRRPDFLKCFLLKQIENSGDLDYFRVFPLVLLLSTTRGEPKEYHRLIVHFLAYRIRKPTNYATTWENSCGHHNIEPLASMFALCDVLVPLVVRGSAPRLPQTSGDPWYS